MLEFLFNRRPATLLKRDFNTGVFRENCETFRKTFFSRMPPVATFDSAVLSILLLVPAKIYLLKFRNLYPFIFSTSLWIAAKNIINGNKRLSWHLSRHDKRNGKDLDSKFFCTIQQTFVRSKKTIKALEKGVKYVQR